MVIPNIEIHKPSDTCYAMHCTFHDVDEPITEDTYRVCGECGHAFETDVRLIVETNKTNAAMEKAVPGAELPRHVTADDINHCPFCYHDF
jgi:hypothetical protein